MWYSDLSAATSASTSNLGGGHVTIQNFEGERSGSKPVAGWLDQMRAAHHFMLRHSLYPIALSSLLACVIFAGRVYLSRSWTYHFLIWNLFLAWVPYVCSLWAAWLHQRHPGRWWYLLIPCSLWLIFFPNAPYIVTDLLHLRERPHVPMWYDIGLLVTFAWTGCFLGFISLRTMQTLVKDFVGRIASWAFAFVVLGLSGIGIYLGRFQRFNSWDLFLNPGEVLTDVVSWLIHPRHHLQTFGVSILFTTILVVCYLTFTSDQHHERL
jgi:uncharacterized membrane protein